WKRGVRAKAGRRPGAGRGEETRACAHVPPCVHRGGGSSRRGLRANLGPGHGSETRTTLRFAAVSGPTVGRPPLSNPLLPPVRRATRHAIIRDLFEGSGVPAGPRICWSTHGFPDLERL